MAHDDLRLGPGHSCIDARRSSQRPRLVATSLDMHEFAIRFGLPSLARYEVGGVRGPGGTNQLEKRRLYRTTSDTLGEIAGMEFLFPIEHRVKYLEGAQDENGVAKLATDYKIPEFIVNRRRDFCATSFIVFARNFACSLGAKPNYVGVDKHGTSLESKSL